MTESAWPWLDIQPTGAGRDPEEHANVPPLPFLLGSGGWEADAQATYPLGAGEGDGKQMWALEGQTCKDVSEFQAVPQS